MNQEKPTEEFAHQDAGIVYNVTIKVEWTIASAWLSWIKDDHIVAVISTGCFTHAKILRLLETDDTDGPTFAIQYFAENRESYQRYISEFAADMRKQTSDKWGDKVVAFRSVLAIVD